MIKYIGYINVSIVGSYIILRNVLNGKNATLAIPLLSLRIVLNLKSILPREK